MATKYPKKKHSRTDKKVLAANDMEAVSSSWISAIGVIESNLIIRLINGSMYTYYNAGALYDNFLKASSKGKFFWKFLRRPKVPFMKGGRLPLPSDTKVTDADLLETLQQELLNEVVKAIVKHEVVKKILTDPITGKRIAAIIVGGHVINQALID